MGSSNLTANDYDIPATVQLLPQNTQLLCLMTILRNAETECNDFTRIANIIGRQLITQALNHVPYADVDIRTSTGAVYTGIKPVKGICGISILRAGASLEEPLRDCWHGPLSFGKILIQRDEKTHLPVHLYSKLPSNLQYQVVLLLEPMLATGGSCCKAIELIKEQGIAEADIIFVNFIASKKGIKVVNERFPQIRIITAGIDADLDENSHVVPGLGDFGDRYYGTV